MQNDENPRQATIYEIIIERQPTKRELTKRQPRKRKRKIKEGTPSSSFWSKVAEGSWAPGTLPKYQIKKPPQESTTKIHHQDLEQDLMDLTDDTSPQNPMASTTGATSAKKDQSGIVFKTLTPAQLSWKQKNFLKSLKFKTPKSHFKGEVQDFTKDPDISFENNSIHFEAKCEKNAKEDNPPQATLSPPKMAENPINKKTSVSTQETKIAQPVAPIVTISQNQTMVMPEAPVPTPNKGDGRGTHEVIYVQRVKYPAGIPRSFLNHPPKKSQIQTNQPNPKDQTIWTSHKRQTLEQTQSQVEPNGSKAAAIQSSPTFVPIGSQVDKPKTYSPSQSFGDYDDEEIVEPESPDTTQGQKRLSAFDRLGPLSQPKKPKMTINLMFNKEQSVREVIDVSDEEKEAYTPVHLRKDVINSTDETVQTYLPYWPWKRSVKPRKKVTARSSKSVMLLEQEQMMEVYDKDNLFITVFVTGYPPDWKKEQVLDAVLDSIRGLPFIPCFIEFTREECKFLVLRSRAALIAIHKYGFHIRHGDVELTITLGDADITLKKINFIPRLALRKRLSMAYDSERKLDLSSFTLDGEISHFMYYPLNRVSNQTELIQLQGAVAWDYITDLNLSHNRISNLHGFDFAKLTPRLQNLDLSHNALERISPLLRSRGLALRSLRLEGNPLCRDYTRPDHYLRALRAMFPDLSEIDGVKLNVSGRMPEMKKNYCPEDAKPIVERFLEIFFPLLDMEPEYRSIIQDMYDKDAVLTITYREKLCVQAARCYRSLFVRSRALAAGRMDAVEGAGGVARLLARWPALRHDPLSLTVDVLHHEETSTVLRIGGIVKITAETLAEDELMLAFTRTVVLTTKNGIEYKIQNEMLYWDEMTKDYAKMAFQKTALKIAPITLKLETPPDDELKKHLLDIFMKLTYMTKKASERCLEKKEWHMKNALEYYSQLLKLDNLDALFVE